MQRRIVSRSIALIFFVLVTAGCLTACGLKDGINSAMNLIERTPETTATPEPTPEPAPEPTPEPTPEPVSVFQPGVSCCINGEAVEMYVYNDTEFVLFERYMTSAGFECAADDNGVTFSFRGAGYSIDYESCMLKKNGDNIGLENKIIYEFGLLYLPVSNFSAAIGVSEFVDEESGIAYYTPGAGSFEITADRNVPVLMYHCLSDNVWGYSGLFVSPSSFEEQLAYLAENGYQTIFFEDLWNLDAYDKPVIITFDDGYMDNYEYAFPLLQKYNMKATVFAIAGWLNSADGLYLSSDRVKEMSDSGLVSIQSHTISHPKLSSLAEDSMISEMTDSKLILTRITGKEPYVLCYPYGDYSNAVLNHASEYYNFGTVMQGGTWNTSYGNYIINRYYVERGTGINSFASFLAN